MVIGNHTRQQDVKHYSSVGYYSNYVSGVLIIQYNQQGDITYSMGLTEAYPIIVNSLPLNWGSEDLHRLTVQFTYKHFQETDEPALGRPARSSSGRGGLTISGLPSLDSIIGEIAPDLPSFGDLLRLSTNG